MQHGRWTHESRNRRGREEGKREGSRFERKDGEEEEEEEVEAPVQDLATKRHWPSVRRNEADPRR